MALTIADASLVVVMIFFVFGAAVGSFLNVCIYRLPLRESIVFPASHCRTCAAPLPWYDNLPLISYLFLRGHCRSCGASFSPRYLLVELLTALLTVGLVWQFGLTVAALSAFVLVAALIVITFIDLDYQLIPDVISVPGIVLGFLFSLVSPTLTWWSSLVGIALGGGILLAVAEGYRFLTGREGMGGGDVKLLAMIGAFLGWRAVPFTLFVASLVGSVVGLAVMVRHQGNAQLALPFGPFLAFGALCYLFFGERLIDWYLGLL